MQHVVTKGDTGQYTVADDGDSGETNDENGACGNHWSGH